MKTSYSCSCSALDFRNALLDYVEMICKQISKRFIKPPSWWTPPTPEAPPPRLRKPDLKCYEDKKTGNSRLCVRCQEEEDMEESLRRDDEEKERAEQKDKIDMKQKARERMKRKFAEEKRNKEEEAVKRGKIMK